MSRVRRNLSPELCHPSSSTMDERPDDSSFEGIATNVKLLLKLVQDHNEACARDNIDERQVQRVAGMMTILDDVKSRIQKSHSFGKKREAELRRCYTDLRPDRVPRDKRANEVITDEKQKLRKELTSSLAARKSLEMMCSSVGKEKEFMAAELARKVHELSGIEELVNDLKAQNEMLLAKVQTCAAEHKEKKYSVSSGGLGERSQGNNINVALQERNKALSVQLLKSLDGYRSLKRKLKEAQEENSKLHGTMEEIGEEVEVGLDRIRGFQQQMVTGKNNEEQVHIIEEEILALQHMFECFKIKVSENGKKKS